MKILSILVLVGLLITAPPVRATTMHETVCPLPAPDTQTENIESKPLTRNAIFRHSYDEAECLRRAATTMGAEWLETESLLQRALEEAAGGHWETASQLVRKAHFQAEKALQQANIEAEAWKHRVIK